LNDFHKKSFHLLKPMRKVNHKISMDSRIKKILRSLRKYNPKKVILFGSHAKMSYDRYSDIDLIIIKKTRKRFLNRIKEVLEIIKPDYPIDILVYTPEEFQRMISKRNPFIEFVIKEGKVIYEKSRTRIETLV